MLHELLLHLREQDRHEFNLSCRRQDKNKRGGPRHHGDEERKARIRHAHQLRVEKYEARSEMRGRRGQEVSCITYEPASSDQLLHFFMGHGATLKEAIELLRRRGVAVASTRDVPKVGSMNLEFSAADEIYPVFDPSEASRHGYHVLTV